MSSIALSRPDIKLYLQSIGPGLGRPPRPEFCPACGYDRIWYDGWRLAFNTILDDGSPFRFNDGIWQQRVACGRCWFSWTCRPAFLYQHRSYGLDVVEAACLDYLQDLSATYAETGRRYGCSPTVIWEWIGWLSRIIDPGKIMAEAARLGASLVLARMSPKRVPQNHPKGLSAQRQRILLRSLQLLVALLALARAQVIPPGDPSPLRWFLTEQFRVFRRKALVSRPGWSPSFELAKRHRPG